MQLLNWDMLKHPVNWVVILLMLLIAAIGGHFLMKLFGVEPSATA